MSRRWFWEGIPSDDGAPYAVMYLDDGENRGVTYCLAFTQGDAEEIIDALRWQDAFRLGKGFFLPSPEAPPKKAPVKRKKPVSSRSRK